MAGDVLKESALKSVYEGSIVGQDAGNTLGGLGASARYGNGIDPDSAAVSGPETGGGSGDGMSFGARAAVRAQQGMGK